MLSKIDSIIANSKINSLSANIAGQLKLTEIDIKEWLEKLINILHDFHLKYGNYQFVLILNNYLKRYDSSILLSSELLWDFISKKQECFYINSELNICLANISDSEIETVSKYCFDNKVPALHVTGEGMSFYDIKGLSICYFNFVHPQVDKRNRLGLNARSYRDYKYVIDEQSAKQLVNKMDEIWADRKKRILNANRKTEKILQAFLFKWLYDNIYDARVISEVGKISGIDRTDIEIIDVLTGDNIIIEVKWMGKNAANTGYNITRLKQGIRQVCTYLQREPSALEGCVVCYDGRQESEKDNPFNLDEPIARLDYKIVWLESRTGSEIGEKS